MNKQKLILKLMETGFQAGEAILDIYREYSEYQIEMKEDKTPLTKADRRSNEIICNNLKQISPGIPIISEENKQLDYHIRKSYDRFWLVDPLDGTKEFIKKNGEFTVNIALVENGKSVMGMVYCPYLDEMYWAIEGEGAYQKTDDGPVELRVQTFQMNDPGLHIVCSRSHLNPQTEEYINSLYNPKLVSRGSSLKFLMVAKGDAHIYPRIAPTMEWDTAAAQIILEEAGGKVSEFGSGEPLRYNKENLLNPFFIALGYVTK